MYAEAVRVCVEGFVGSPQVVAGWVEMVGRSDVTVAACTGLLQCTLQNRFMHCAGFNVPRSVVGCAALLPVCVVAVETCSCEISSYDEAVAWCSNVSALYQPAVEGCAVAAVGCSVKVTICLEVVAA